MSCRPLRIAFISYEYPPHVEGGAGVYGLCLTNELVTLGHSVSIFTPNRGPGRHNARVVPVGRAGTRAAGFWAALPAAVMRAARRSGHFDVIHGNALADFSLARCFSRSARVVTLHHVARRLPPPGLAGLRHRLGDLRGETGIGPLCERIILQRANRVICVSRPAMNDAIHLCGLHASRATVIPNGMSTPRTPDIALMQSLRATYCRGGEFLLLSVGRLENRKGIAVLLEALAHVPFAHLVCVGDGAAEPYQHLARRFQVQDRVHFVGRVTDAARDALYAVCDVYVSAALHEGFGLTTFEAMAMGKPVVVTMTGAAAAGWVSHEHGAAVPPGDVGALHDALTRLLVLPEKRRSVGMSNQAYAARWKTWNWVAIETEHLYREAIVDHLSAAGLVAR